MSNGNKHIILCIEDEREVLDALVRDLESFEPTFRIEPAESADEARGVVDQAVQHGDRIALVLADHIMPGTPGVDFLVELNRRPQTVHTRKVLVTAQAGLQDTIKAVNDADLDHYIAKPWSKEELIGVVKRQLTDYVIQNEEDVMPFLKVLNTPRLLDAVRKTASDR